MLEIKENIPLAPYTIYKIGGPARFFAEAKNAMELESAVRYAREKSVPFFIMGAGSNMLVSDRGFDGVAIRMAGGGVRGEGERLIADAGVMMARAVMEAARAGLAGFEWGVGVPGTVGGSVRGNAGCFGGEMKNIFESGEIFDTKKVSSFKFQAADCGFAYRDSIFKQHPEWVIVSATLRLKKGDQAAIQNEIRRITAERNAKQDIGTKSCGCIFKNPAWPESAKEKEELLREHPELAPFSERAHIPGSFLIDRAGMKGQCVGCVCVSGTHANFFINEGGATAADVCSLIARAKEKVAKLFGVTLQEEIQYIGF